MAKRKSWRTHSVSKHGSVVSIEKTGEEWKCCFLENLVLRALVVEDSIEDVAEGRRASKA